MPNFGSGKVSSGVSLEDMVVGPLQSAGRVVRNKGSETRHKSWAQLQKSWARVGGVVETTEDFAVAVADSAEELVAEVFGAIEGSVEVVSETFECVTTRAGAAIRRAICADEDRNYGGIKQIACPPTRSERCAGCVLNIVGREDFSFEKLGGVVDVALGNVTVPEK